MQRCSHRRRIGSERSERGLREFNSPQIWIDEVNPEVERLTANSKRRIAFYKRDVAQPGSALAWGARGRWFKSSHPDQKSGEATVAQSVEQRIRNARVGGSSPFSGSENAMKTKVFIFIFSLTFYFPLGH